MSQSIAGEGATILPFVPRVRRPAGLSEAERISARFWALAAQPFGVRAVQVHDPEPGDDPAMGSFLLIYCGDALWARWGVAVGGGRYELWCSSRGVTIGRFATLAEALAAISDSLTRAVTLR